MSADTEDIEGMDMEDEESDTEEQAEDGQTQVYLPDQQLEEGEELVCDDTAYVMYHAAQTGAPCLSFDIIKDHLGNERDTYPMTMYLVAGTQAERAHANNVIVMKMDNLKKNKTEKPEEDAEESDEDSDSDDEEKPELENAMIRHNGSVNRIRCTQIDGKHLAASWSEQGKVHIWDLTRPLHAVNDSQVMSTYTRNSESPEPVYSFAGHQVEGFAIDWCQTDAGKLATGDCNKNIHIWSLVEGGKWHVDQRPFTGHTASVEDIQWSPNEPNVFSSCSVDKSIRVWDARAPPSKACMLTTSDAHDRDINVINWNRNEPFIVSGGDDGILKIWDLRQFKKGKPVALFKHHTAPITSVEWHHQDSSVFAASGSDNQVTLWDLAVERDTEEMGNDEDELSVPPQLLFIHQGQTDVKEIHWHPQCSGVIISTAHSGLNVFRTISV